MAFVSHIDHVAMMVRDLHSSVRWYQAVLKLEKRFQDVMKVNRSCYAPAIPAWLSFKQRPQGLVLLRIRK